MDEETKLRLAQMDRSIEAPSKYNDAKARIMDRAMSLLENLVERVFNIIAEERAKNG
jgi:hypothetical protein